MKAQQEFKSFLDSEILTLWIKLPKKHFWSKRDKFKFQLKPIVPEDLIDMIALRKRVEEIKIKMGKSTSSEEGVFEKIAAEMKNKFLKMDWNETAKFILTRGSLNPKIVDKKKDLKDDEISYTSVPDNIKRVLIEHIRKISPIFGGKIA